MKSVNPIVILFQIIYFLKFSISLKSNIDINELAFRYDHSKDSYCLTLAKAVENEISIVLIPDGKLGRLMKRVLMICLVDVWLFNLKNNDAQTPSLSTSNNHPITIRSIENPLSNTFLSDGIYDLNSALLELYDKAIFSKMHEKKTNIFLIHPLGTGRVLKRFLGQKHADTYESLSESNRYTIYIYLS
jgi:hypothetical protein